MSEEAVSILVHGEPGVGKSTLGVSGPVPRLLMDVENSARFINQRKIKWNPLTEKPPVYDGSWELCVTKLKDWETAQASLNWLRSGDHPFKSVSVDSISELQIKAQEAINKRDEMKIQHWGRLLQNMGGYLRDLRDIVGEENQTMIETMVLVSTSKTHKDGSLKPYLQGGIAQQVPYIFDITGYLYVDQIADPVTGEIKEERVLFTGKHPMFEAKSRVPNLPPRLIRPDLTVITHNIFNGMNGVVEVPSVEVQS